MSFLEVVNWLLVAIAVVMVALKAVAPKLPVVQDWKPSMLLIAVGIACSAASNLMMQYRASVSYGGVVVFAPFVFFALAIYQMRNERNRPA